VFRMLARRRSQVLVTPGTDRVIWAMSLPNGTVVHDIKGEVHVIGTLDNRFDEATFYGLEVYILPVFDPDASNSAEVLWDQLVPKDTDVQAIDLDSAAADTTPFFEPGEADWSQVLDVGVRPRKLYGRYKMVTGLNSAFAGRDPATPFGVETRLGEIIPMRIKKSFRVSQPSMLVCALASPAMDDTTTTVELALSENEWSRVMYAEQMLEQAHMDLIGLTEAGAETPWEDATDLLQKHLEPDVFEETATNFVSEQWQTYADIKIDHSVKGRLDIKMLSTGR